MREEALRRGTAPQYKMRNNLELSRLFQLPTTQAIGDEIEVLSASNISWNLKLVLRDARRFGPSRCRQVTSNS
jgi:hypothetical protein